ncbi:MAG TPA: response regulator [Candidatus Paceibacterota bacterium]
MIQNPKIFLVEDDPLLMDIYTTKFKQAGFDVEVIESGERVSERVKEEQPDLILLDIVLPRVDGWDILRQLKQEEKTKSIPVIILSNLGQKEEIAKGLELGATSYLIKAHYTPSEIVEEIKKLL